MPSAASLGSTVQFATSGALGANERLKLAQLDQPTSVSAAGATQPPGFIAERHGNKTVVVPSTKPLSPPTFQATNDRSSVIKMPYVAPVYYTKAGALSQPIQDLGHGALVNITA